MMKKYIFPVFLIIFCLGITINLEAKPKTKVTICHLDQETGEFKEITISESAAGLMADEVGGPTKHFAHGDKLYDDTVGCGDPVVEPFVYARSFLDMNESGAWEENSEDIELLRLQDGANLDNNIGTLELDDLVIGINQIIGGDCVIEVGVGPTECTTTAYALTENKTTLSDFFGELIVVETTYTPTHIRFYATDSPYFTTQAREISFSTNYSFSHTVGFEIYDPYRHHGIDLASSGKTLSGTRMLYLGDGDRDGLITENPSKIRVPADVPQKEVPALESNAPLFRVEIY
ncbi:MAG: hypothetical protein KDK65_02095 [Chlamydiia bacterium]|nr:hypothetical protein [Chlamydiia bacterium]